MIVFEIENRLVVIQYPYGFRVLVIERKSNGAEFLTTEGAVLAQQYVILLSIEDAQGLVSRILGGSCLDRYVWGVDSFYLV